MYRRDSSPEYSTRLPYVSPVPSYITADDCDDDTIEPADAYQGHNDPVDPGSDD